MIEIEKAKEILKSKRINEEENCIEFIMQEEQGVTQYYLDDDVDEAIETMLNYIDKLEHENKTLKSFTSEIFNGKVVWRLNKDIDKLPNKLGGLI